jgi:hypothetical protein
MRRGVFPGRKAQRVLDRERPFRFFLTGAKFFFEHLPAFKLHTATRKRGLGVTRSALKVR